MDALKWMADISNEVFFYSVNAVTSDLQPPHQEHHSRRQQMKVSSEQAGEDIRNRLAAQPRSP